MVYIKAWRILCYINDLKGVERKNNWVRIYDGLWQTCDAAINLIENIPSRNEKSDGMKNIKCKMSVRVILRNATLIYLSSLFAQNHVSFLYKQIFGKIQWPNDIQVPMLLHFNFYILQRYWNVVKFTFFSIIPSMFKKSYKL